MTEYNQIFGPSFLPGKAMNGPVTFFDDFLTGVTENGAKFATTADLGDWLVTADVFTSHGANPTVQDDADGGWVRFASDDDAGDQVTMRANGESFLLAIGRRTVYETRLRFVSTTQDALWGISVNTTDPLGTRPSDYIGFELDGTADLEFTADTGSAATAQVDTTANVVAGTFATFSFIWDGIDTIRVYFNGAKVYQTKTTIPVGTFMSPFFTVQSAGAEPAMTIDYVLIVNDRAA